MLTMGNLNNKYDLFPDVGVLDTPPKIISWSGQATEAAWHRFYITDISKSQHTDYGYAAITFLNWAWEHGPRDITEITPEIIENHIEALEHTGLENKTILIHLCGLKRFFDMLCSENILSRSPLGGTHQVYYIPPKLLVDFSGPDPRFLEAYSNYLARHVNQNSLETYHSALSRFFSYCEEKNVTAHEQIDGPFLNGFVRSFRVMDAAGLTDHKISTVRVTMSAVRGYFDALIVAGVIDRNIARAVKLPKSVVGKGATPVLEPVLVTRILEAIPLKTQADYRDRALIALMAYSLFRISAALRMKVHDYVQRGDVRYLCAIEKGSKRHDMPVHPALQHYIDEYLVQADLLSTPEAPLFQGGTPHGGKLTGRTYGRVGAWKMVQRRARAAGYFDEIGNHSFRATGITAYLASGGVLEEARKMAGHKSAETTRIYDRNIDEVDPDEVAKINF